MNTLITALVTLAIYASHTYYLVHYIEFCKVNNAEYTFYRIQLYLVSVNRYVLPMTGMKYLDALT